MIYMPEVGAFCEVSCEDHADYDWVKIHVVHIHNGVVIGVVDMPGELIHDDIEKYAPGYNRAVFREIATEASISAQNPAWNGEGLPPAGCEFEYSFSGNGFVTWHQVKCTAVGCSGVLCVDEKGTEMYRNNINNRFRPIRTEAERKREEVAESLVRFLDKETDIDNIFRKYDVMGFIDYIEAGKIPGVRLTDETGSQ